MNNLNQKELLILMFGLEYMWNNMIDKTHKIKFPYIGGHGLEHIDVTLEEITNLKIKLQEQHKEGLNDN